MYFIDKWISKHIGYEANLKECIGISPIFTTEQMMQPASEVIDFYSYSTTLQNEPAYIGALILKSDQIRFLNAIILGSASEQPPIANLRDEWQKRNLQEFIESQDIIKYSLDNDAA